jgi:hypothetical protein
MWRGSGENYIKRSFMLCTPHQIPFGWSNEGKLCGRGVWHVWGRRETHTSFDGKKWKEMHRFEESRHIWEDNIKMVLQEIG